MIAWWIAAALVLWILYRERTVGQAEEAEEEIARDMDGSAGEIQGERRDSEAAAEEYKEIEEDPAEDSDDTETLSASERSEEEEEFLDACIDGDLYTVRQLLEEGAVDVDSCQEEGGFDGYTALMIAATYDHVDIVRLLLAHGAKVNESDPWLGKTALHLASELSVVKMLLDKSATVNASAHNWDTPLHAAIRNKLEGKVAVLLEHGASVDSQNAMKHKPIHVLLEQTNRARRAAEDIAAFHDMAQSLVRHGAKWDDTCDQLIDEKDNVSLSFRVALQWWVQESARGDDELTAIPEEILLRGPSSVQQYLEGCNASSKMILRRNVCVVASSFSDEPNLFNSICDGRPALEQRKKTVVGDETFSVPYSNQDLTTQTLLLGDRIIGTNQLLFSSSERSSMVKDVVMETEERALSQQLAGECESSIESSKSTQEHVIHHHHEVTFLDLADHEAREVAHPAFFSKRTLYLVCVDLQAYAVAFEQSELRANNDYDVERFMNEFVETKVLRWVRRILARQPNAEFVFVGTKADVLVRTHHRVDNVREDLKKRMGDFADSFESISCGSDIPHGRVHLRSAPRGTPMQSSRALVASAKRLNNLKWVEVDCSDQASVEAARIKIEQIIIESNRSFRMPELYSQVLDVILSRRHEIMAKRPLNQVAAIFLKTTEVNTILREELPDQADNLSDTACEAILRTLHDLGEVLWFEDIDIEYLKDTVILDPQVLTQLVRQIVDNNHNSEVITHEALKEQPFWNVLDSDRVVAMRQLLQQLHFVRPTGSKPKLDSDMIAPAHWRSKQNATWLSLSDLLDNESTLMKLEQDICMQWEYHFTTAVADEVFSELLIESYSEKFERHAGPDWVLYTVGDQFACSALVTRAFGTVQRVLRVEAIASESAEAFTWERFEHLCESLEKVLSRYDGLVVRRHTVEQASQHRSRAGRLPSGLSKNEGKRFDQHVTEVRPKTMNPGDTGMEERGSEPDNDESESGGTDNERQYLMACAIGDERTVRSLLDCGDVDVNLRYKVGDWEGMTALMRAVTEDDAQIVELLIAHGADVNATEPKFRKTALHLVSSSIVTKMLLEASADPNSVDTDGDTPLHNVVSYWGGQENLVALLLDHAAAVDVVNKQGRTPLATLVQQVGHRDVEAHHIIARALVSYGAKWDDSCDEILEETGSPRQKCFRVAILWWMDEHTRGVRDLTDVPEEVFQSGPSTVEQYLGAIHASDKIVLRHKVCVLGPSSWGKTSLVKSVLKGKPVLEHAGDQVLQHDGLEPLHRLLKTTFHQLTESKTLDTLQELVACGATWDAKCDEIVATGKTWDEAPALRLCVLLWAQELADGLPFTDIPIEVVQRGVESTQAYIDSMKSSSEIVFRRKICVVGPSCAGKTTLVKSILAKKPRLEHVDDRTIGIDHFPLRFERPGTKRKDLAIHEVTFMDFAGQDEYQVAHSLFFSPRTLFLVCIDLEAYRLAFTQASIMADSKEQETQIMDEFAERSVMRWIRMIMTRQRDAEFVFIATKEDLLGENTVTQRLLKTTLLARLKDIYVATQEMLPRVETIKPAEVDAVSFNAPNVVFVSCASSESVASARSMIEDIISKSDRGFQMPDTYSQALEAIIAMRVGANSHDITTRGHLILAPVETLPARLKLKPELCRSILQTLHDLGDVLWYEDLGVELFQDHVILDPLRLIDLIRQVINPKQTGQTMSHADLKALPYWNVLSDTGQFKAMKQLLEKFHLVYSADENRTMSWDSDLIVPAYWQTKTPATWLWSGDILRINDTKSCEDEAARIHWEYDFEFGLPSSLFDHLVVANVSPDFSFDAGPDWIVFEEKNIAACRIMVGRDGKSLHRMIHVEAVIAKEADPKQAKMLWRNFEHLVSAFVEVMREFSGLDVSSFAWDDTHDKIGFERLLQANPLLTPACEKWMPPVETWAAIRQLMLKTVKTNA